jgi:hypothetical protein
VVQRNGGATAAYANAQAIVGARLIIIHGCTIRNAMPNFLLRKQRKQEGTLKIKATEIALVDLNESEQK